MTDNVTRFPGTTTLDLAPDTLLTEAVGQLSDVVIVGFNHDGEFWFASSSADAAEVVWLLERTKHKLMQTTDALERGEDA